MTPSARRADRRQRCELWRQTIIRGEWVLVLAIRLTQSKRLDELLRSKIVLPHEVIVRKMHDSFGDRRTDSHPVERISINRPKLPYLQGVMSLHRQLFATRVEEARAESASIELIAGTPERALDAALPDTLDAMSKACCADLRSSRACSERAGSFTAQMSRSVSRRSLTSSCPRAD